MFSQRLIQNQPFASKFFSNAINSEPSKFAHAYMLTGSNIYEQYFLALQVAKVLNCQNNSEINLDTCTCNNCSWINQNRHPAVITISPIDFLYDETGNQTSGSTVIKVDQARYLRKVLSMSSNYHRVIIFTDATENSEQGLYEKALSEQYKNIIATPQNEISEERDHWEPLPITYKVFQNETANTLLKSIEEPAPKITFFFLTRDKEDVIETIVSRCQVVPVSSGSIPEIEISLPDGFEALFPIKDYNSALILSEKFLLHSKSSSININVLLDYLQEYIRRLIKFNCNDGRLVSIFIEFIRKIESAKQRLTSYVSPQSVLDSLFLSLVVK